MHKPLSHKSQTKVSLPIPSYNCQVILLNPCSLFPSLSCVSSTSYCLSMSRSTKNTNNITCVHTLVPIYCVFISTSCYTEALTIVLRYVFKGSLSPCSYLIRYVCTMHLLACFLSGCGSLKHRIKLYSGKQHTYHLNHKKCFHLDSFDCVPGSCQKGTCPV